MLCDKVRWFGRWAAANCTAPPTANAGQYATSICKPLVFRFSRECVRTFNPSVIVDVAIAGSLSVGSTLHPWRGLRNVRHLVHASNADHLDV